MTTDQIPDYLSLIGDTSDNIPGVPGVGPKTAAKWLNEYGNLDCVTRNAAELKPIRFREILPAMIEQLKINRKIIAFDPDCGPDSIPDGNVDPSTLFSILEKMEMKRINFLLFYYSLRYVAPVSILLIFIYSIS